MRVVVLAAGTRGDLQPYLGLAGGLARAGHTVRIATHASFAALVAAHGFEYAELGGDPAAMFDQTRWTSDVVSRRRPLAHARLIREVVGGLLAEITPEQVTAASAGADAVVVTMTTEWAAAVAQELGLPVAAASYAPFARTREFPHCVLAGGLSFGALGNRLTYPFAQQALGEPLAEPVRPGARRAVGLAPVPGFGRSERWPPLPVLHGFSAHVVPRPADWPAQLSVTGYWFAPTPEGTALDPALEAFLDGGEPPVYIGFGSMRVPDPAALLQRTLDAVAAAGVRAIVDGPWRGQDDPRVHRISGAPHELLFPRVRGVVTHGGAGTVSAALRAGRPTLAVPFVFDQFFWGGRVAALGAGPRPIPFERFGADALAAGLRALDAHAAAADRLGAAIRAEDGAGVAAATLERVFA